MFVALLNHYNNFNFTKINDFETIEIRTTSDILDYINSNILSKFKDGLECIKRKAMYEKLKILTKVLKKIFLKFLVHKYLNHSMILNKF